MPRTSQLIEERKRRDKSAAEAVARGEVTVAGVGVREAVTELTAKPWQMNLWMLLGILAVMAIVTAVFRAWTEETRLWWLVAIPQPPQAVGEFSVVLAPLVAVAVAIERLLETGFNWYEQSVKTVSDIVAKAREPIDWIEEELKQAYDAAAAAAAKTGIVASKESLEALNRAEERLIKAEQRLLGWVKAPEYVAWKQAISIWIGLLVGLEVAVLGDLGMLHMIGVPAPRLLDMLATGLVVGAGPGPLHSIIGMLQGGKNALDKVAELADGRALREAAAALRENTTVQP